MTISVTSSIQLISYCVMYFTDESLSEEDLILFLNESYSGKICDSRTKCIAFEEKLVEKCKGNRNGDSSGLSSASTSDLTAVTPCSSASDYCFLPVSSCSVNKSYTNQPKPRVLNANKQQKKTNMPLLEEALGSLNICKNSQYTPSTTNKVGPRRRNMSFTNEQLRKIERENEILLRKIMSHSKQRFKFDKRANENAKILKPTAFINRTKAEHQIGHDNFILLKKIQTVKPGHKHCI